MSNFSRDTNDSRSGTMTSLPTVLLRAATLDHVRHSIRFQQVTVLFSVYYHMNSVLAPLIICLCSTRGCSTRRNNTEAGTLFDLPIDFQRDHAKYLPIEQSQIYTVYASSANHTLQAIAWLLRPLRCRAVDGKSTKMKAREPRQAMAANSQKTAVTEKTQNRNIKQKPAPSRAQQPQNRNRQQRPQGGGARAPCGHTLGQFSFRLVRLPAWSQWREKGLGLALDTKIISRVHDRPPPQHTPILQVHTSFPTHKAPLPSQHHFIQPQRRVYHSRCTSHEAPAFGAPPTRYLACGPS